MGRGGVREHRGLPVLVDPRLDIGGPAPLLPGLRVLRVGVEGGAPGAEGPLLVARVEARRRARAGCGGGLLGSGARERIAAGKIRAA